MTCAICRTRRPRRFCPGVRGDICTLCCGTEREVTVACPLDCEFLREARKHDRAAPVDAASIPNQDIPVTEEFLGENEELFTAMAEALVGAALEAPEAIDFDVREALEALIRTQRTMQSGLYYESFPDNPLAARICRAVRDGVEAFRKAETERLGMSRTRDSAVLGLLAFLQRFELDRNNGRRRGRAFIDAMLNLYSGAAGDSPPESPSLLLP